MIIYDEPNETYHANEAFSSTEAKTFLRSPQLFKDTRDGIAKRIDSDAFAFGTMTHEAVLEKEERFAHMAIKPDGMSFAKKEGKAWRDEQQAAGKTIVKQSEVKDMQHMLERMPDEVQMIFYDGGKPEVTFRHGSKPGVQCRFDWYIDERAFDLKTIIDIDKIEKQIFGLGYDLSMGWYDMVHELETGERLRSWEWVFAEKNAPYRWKIIVPDNSFRDRCYNDAVEVYELMQAAWDLNDYSDGEDTTDIIFDREDY